VDGDEIAGLEMDVTVVEMQQLRGGRGKQCGAVSAGPLNWARAETLGVRSRRAESSRGVVQCAVWGMA
jgi:hypothetical protein